MKKGPHFLFLLSFSFSGFFCRPEGFSPCMISNSKTNNSKTGLSFYHNVHHVLTHNCQELASHFEIVYVMGMGKRCIYMYIYKKQVCQKIKNIVNKHVGVCRLFASLLMQNGNVLVFMKDFFNALNVEMFFKYQLGTVKIKVS